MVICLLTECTKETNEGVTITMDEYNQEKIGISYDELKTIVCGDCIKNAELDMMGIKQAIYTCNGEKSDSNAIFTFENDKLVSKVYAGL